MSCSDIAGLASTGLEIVLSALPFDECSHQRCLHGTGSNPVTTEHTHRYIYRGIESLSLIGFNDAFNIIYASILGGIQVAVLSGNHTIKSAVIFRLSTQNKEGPKKRNRFVIVTNIRRKSGKGQ